MKQEKDNKEFLENLNKIENELLRKKLEAELIFNKLFEDDEPSFFKSTGELILIILNIIILIVLFFKH